MKSVLSLWVLESQRRGILSSRHQSVHEPSAAKENESRQQSPRVQMFITCNAPFRKCFLSLSSSLFFLSLHVGLTLITFRIVYKLKIKQI